MPGATTPEPKGSKQLWDERDGHPVGVDSAEVDSPAGRLAHGLGTRSDALVEIGVADQLGDIGSVTYPCQPVLERQPYALDERGQRRLRALEEPERLERDDALIGGWQLQYFRSSVGQPDRLDPARVVA